MEKILKEEIDRINELLGTKLRIDEQIKSFVQGLISTLQDDILNIAKKMFSGRNINSISDITEDELLKVIKSQAARAVRLNLYAELTKKLLMDNTKFVAKSAYDLMQDLAKIGVKDPDIAAAYLKRFAKENSVDTFDKKFASVIGVEKLSPTGGRKADLVIDMSKKNSTEIADELGKKYGKDKVQEFVNKLNVLGMDEKHKKLFLVDFKNYHDWTSLMLDTELQTIKKQMSAPQKKAFESVISSLTSKGVWKKIGYGSLSIITVMIAVWVIKNVNKITGTSKDVKELIPIIDDDTKDSPKETKPEENSSTDWNQYKIPGSNN